MDKTKHACILWFLLIVPLSFPLCESSTNSFENRNKEIDLIKPNANVDDYTIEWYHAFSPAYGKDIVIDSTNKIYSVGYKSKGDYLILQKFSIHGHREWNITRGEDDTDPSAITCDDENNLYITGRIGYIGDDAKLFVMKYDSDGNCLKFITLEAYDLGTSLSFYQDYLYVTGANYSESGYQLVLLKLDVNLNIEWQVIYDKDKSFFADDMKVDNFIYITGSLSRPDLNHTTRDMMLIKLDLDGNQIWNKTWCYKNYDWGRSLALVQDSIYVAGTSYSTAHNGFLLKFDHNGTLIWECVGSSNHEWNDLVVINETEILVGGQYYVDSRVYTVLKCFNSLGNQEWIKYWGHGGEDCWDSIKAMVHDSNFNIYAVGLSNIQDGVRGMLTFKYAFQMEYAPNVPIIFPSLLVLTFLIFGIISLGTVTTVIILSRNPASRYERRIINRQPRSIPEKIPRHDIHLQEKLFLKCPYCFYEEEIDGNYCPQCGKKLK